MSQDVIRILIADDHEIIREGVAALLNVQPDIEVVAQAANGDEAVTYAQTHQPDVILMDLEMPRKDGLTAIHEIKAANPAARILVLTSFADDARVFPAIKAGALGYLLKDTPRVQLLQAIRAIVQGKAFLHPAIALKIMREFERPAVEPQSYEDILTQRELETLRLIARGLTNKDIATELTVHERTVAKYVSNILQKLHLANRTQAALFALKQGIADLE